MSLLIFSYTFVILAAAIPTFSFVIECICGLVAKQKPNSLGNTDQITTAIIIPAHNEEEVIEDTLISLTSQTGPNDRIIVVADNCSDNTASLARKFRVEVSERFHEEHRGKGYALDHGLSIASDKPPEIVIIVDADCLLEENCLSNLKHECATYNRPIQAKYLIKNREKAGFAGKISEFAILVKNSIRIAGLDALNIPVQLTGTGMAFPWEIIKNAPLASSEIVEDMKLGVDLAIKDSSAKYSANAAVTSYFPSNDDSLKTQRERWEHGHLGLIQAKFIELIRESIKQKRLALLGVLLDICIPPLAFLVLMICGTWALSLIVSLLMGSITYLYLPTILLIAIAISIGIIWFKEARHILSVNDMIKLPYYVLTKMSVYKKFFKKRQTEWIKTDRD